MPPGTLALSTATSAGLASTLSVLAGSGLGPEYLREHSAALGAVDAEGVAAVAEQFAPTELAAVLLGDASVITESVEAIRPLAPGSDRSLRVQQPALSRSTVDRCSDSRG